MYLISFFFSSENLCQMRGSLSRKKRMYLMSCKFSKVIRQWLYLVNVTVTLFSECTGAQWLYLLVNVLGHRPDAGSIKVRMWLMSSSVCATPSSATDRRNSELLTEREESKEREGVKNIHPKKEKEINTLYHRRRRKDQHLCIPEGEGKAEFVQRKNQFVQRENQSTPHLELIHYFGFRALVHWIFFVLKNSVY